MTDRRWWLGTGIEVKSYRDGNFLSSLGWVVLWACIVTVLAGGFLLLAERMAHAECPYPADLWKGLVAEETNGSYDLYYATAWCVRNRLEAGLWHGLVALKRKDLDRFVDENVRYVKTRYGKDTATLAGKAVEAAFSSKDDPTNGATHYEDLNYYPVPKWAKGMKVTAVIEGRTFFLERGA